MKVEMYGLTEEGRVWARKHTKIVNVVDVFIRGEHFPMRTLIDVDGAIYRECVQYVGPGKLSSTWGDMKVFFYLHRMHDGKEMFKWTDSPNVITDEIA